MSAPDCVTCFAAAKTLPDAQLTRAQSGTDPVGDQVLTLTLTKGRRQREPKAKPGAKRRQARAKAQGAAGRITGGGGRAV
jgi:hypothetical protein